MLICVSSIPSYSTINFSSSLQYIKTLWSRSLALSLVLIRARSTEIGIVTLTVTARAHPHLAHSHTIIIYCLDYLISALSAANIDLYYHTTDQEKRRMFPIAPKPADMRTVTSSRTSTHRDNFRGGVQGRVGKCVMTRVPVYMRDAAHLIPHSKCNTVWDPPVRHYHHSQSHRWQYIEAFTARRRRDSSGDVVVV
jgi:hypothetical protein